MVMSGGQWNWNSLNSSPQYKVSPLVRRFGSQRPLPLLQSIGSNTKTSTDPLLRAKPVDPKVPGVPHETDRIVHSIALQSGQGQSSSPDHHQTEEELIGQEDIGDSESSIETDPEPESEDSIKVKNLIVGSTSTVASETGTQIDLSEKSPKKRKLAEDSSLKQEKFKRFKFNILD